MKFNRGGLICVGLYASYVLFMLAVAYLALAVAYLSGCMFEKIILAIAPTLNRIDNWSFDRVHENDR